MSAGIKLQHDCTDTFELLETRIGPRIKFITICCYRMNVCVTPQNLHVEILIINVMVLGGGAFRR